MRLDQGDAQQQNEGEEKKRKNSRFSEFQTTIPGQNLEEPVTHAAVSLGPVRLPSYHGGVCFFLWPLFLFLMLPFFLPV